MEAICVGASVLAFVTLGLNSVKIIDELVASIRGSCAIVDRNDHRLTDKVKSCAEDMKDAAEKLQALTIDGSEPALGRQLKKLKMFLKEKDVKRVASTVAKHTRALSLYLHTIDSEVLLEVKEELSLAVLYLSDRPRYPFDAYHTGSKTDGSG
ncbi:hypothetical protein QBC37DRAFT_378262 [Rhypophila decipiens]|uniref:Uncharacterized protein n=1 Tax=Rhypophila decipiens TaxID=261697 RepID=A0AAN6Y321_9PEZI|nr:hypothetical protein QBC37DRAFT_378262 [Rhypophila decipiens]